MVWYSESEEIKEAISLEGASEEELKLIQKEIVEQETLLQCYHQVTYHIQVWGSAGGGSIGCY